jgi:ribonuclease P protein component
MLPKHQRLQSRWLFRKTLSGLRYYACPAFSIMVLFHWNDAFASQALEKGAYVPRIGFVVSKKVDKRATRRNRLKRLIRETLRQEILPQAGQRLQAVASLAIILRPGATEYDPAALRQQVHHAFSAAQLVRLNRTMSHSSAPERPPTHEPV